MNADNAVSSVDSYLSARWLLLFDLPDLQGTTLWLPGVTWAPNLTMFGFHDRASSFLMLYF
jgi:hypothetical protein